MKRIVVTGATGGLGHRACEMLLEQGIEVVATGRDETKASDLVARGARFRALDLAHASAGELVRLFKGADAIWHCAALSSPWGRAEDFERANVWASRSVASAALLAEVPRLVHVSTPAVYFNYTDHFDVSESFVAERFANHYARTKYEAELAVKRTADQGSGALAVTILRPRALFGPGDQVLLPRLLRVAEQKGGALPLPQGGRVTLDLTYLDNVVDAMTLATAAEREGVRVYNVTNGEPVCLADVLERLFSLLGKPWRIRVVPRPIVDFAARAMELKASFTGREPALTRYSAGVMSYSMTLDITRIRAELGYRPKVSLQTGLEHTAAALARRLS